MKTTTTKNITTVQSYTITADLLFILLRTLRGENVVTQPGISYKAFFTVPGGSNWSYQNLDLNKYPVTLQITTIEETSSEA